MQVDQAIMALSLLNAELVVQRDEARAELEQTKNALAAVAIAAADESAAQRAPKPRKRPAVKA